MIASASMLFAAPAMDTTNMNMQGKGMKMMQNCKYKNSKMGHGMQGKKMMMQKKMAKKRMNSPFLIKHGLPHLTKMIMPYMNDPAFNLTSEQKYQLTKVRTTTMNAIMEAKPKVMALRKEIVNASAAGVSAKALKDKVAKLALLEAAATMTQLKCIESTKDILTKDQIFFLLTNKNKKMEHGKKKMMRGKNDQPKLMKMRGNQSMKCASGKCGQGMNK